MSYDGLDLTDLQIKLFELLARKPDCDVLIKDMYYALYGMPNELVTIREMQQKMAPIIQRINAKTQNLRIEPGQLKQTYRLNTSKA